MLLLQRSNDKMVMENLSTYLRVNRFEPAYYHKFESHLFFEGDKKKQKLVNFTVLLLLSTVIATYGVLADSTATVIGAMIIAPLMTPIMAMAAGVTLGSSDRVGQSLKIVGAGIISVILFALILTIIIPGYSFFLDNNSQIISRISPNILDLFIALGAGAAGAYAMAREEISDSLPGVAIAISLVPPLSVVGVTLAAGHIIQAAGAFLLFITNLIAILLSGIIVFKLMHLEPPLKIESNNNIQRKGMYYVIFSSILIIILLSLSTIAVYQAEYDKLVISNTVEAWIGSEKYTLDKVSSFYSEIDIFIIGDGNLTNIDELGEQLEQQLGRSINLSIHMIPERNMVYPRTQNLGIYGL